MRKPTDRRPAQPSLANLPEAERSARVIQFPTAGRQQAAEAPAGPPIYSQADMDAAMEDTTRRVYAAVSAAFRGDLGPVLPERSLTAVPQQREHEAGA